MYIYSLFKGVWRITPRSNKMEEQTMKANIFIREGRAAVLKTASSPQGQQSNTAAIEAKTEKYYSMSKIVDEDLGVYEKIEGFIVPMKEAMVEIEDALKNEDFFTGVSAKGAYIGITVEYDPQDLHKIGKKYILKKLIGHYALE